ncbi:hypothetical protein SYNPS1DRAFT_27994 [Syncephalis pseudoplumigaleata]|uniref:Lung seven transmembrane receptor-domain-containing protein n=1 Tax=Syncephalis pseudoplumigaleata TaxID=1712513 RepID=A0A4P9Z3D9_9FUNG|nr:hypothetical protein SYNPS1DRAFT_27994 [Syncephalis pseudoplumigaleata]|eukprot:RKP26311.1 hypothetical protein SYNPS1DRAFT_27994 [Syncephalis pseudoplumigaleata]
MLPTVLPAMLKYIVLCTACILSIWSQQASAWATFELGGQRSLSYATQDPFGVRIPQYRSNGTLAMARFVSDAPCTLAFPEANFTDPYTKLALQGYSNAKRVVLAVHLTGAFRNNCLTITHLGIAAHNLRRSMEKNQDGPQFDALLLITYKTRGDIPCPPYELPYTTFGLAYPSGAPPINMTLLQDDGVIAQLRHNGNITEPITAFLAEEPGPWNEAYFSNGRKIMLALLMIINICAAMRGLWTLLQRYIRRVHQPKVQQVIIWFSVFSAILCTAALPQSPVSPAYSWLADALNYCIAIAFSAFLLCCHHGADYLGARVHLLHLHLLEEEPVEQHAEEHAHTAASVGIVLQIISNHLAEAKVWRESVAMDSLRLSLSYTSYTVRIVAMLSVLTYHTDECGEERRETPLVRFKDGLDTRPTRKDSNNHVPAASTNPQALRSSFARISADTTSGYEERGLV